MKLFHTSDWHLGQQFMGKSRDDEHQLFLLWLIEQIHQYTPDALIIAGDIFDTTTPPSYARRRFHDFLEKLTETPIQTVVIIAGNHDSVAVLNESANLLRKLNIHIVAQFDCQRFLNVEKEISEQQLRQILIPVRSQNNQNLAPNETKSPRNVAENTVGYICALPFLRSRDLLASQAEESVTDKTARISQAIIATYQRAFQLSHSIMAENSHSELPLVMTGHLTTLGSSLTESVREIYVGNIEGFSTASFPEANYIALGHIHKHQPASQRRNIHYCGSPIPLSFDESTQQKMLLEVSFTRQSSEVITTIEPIPIPSWQKLQQLQGSLSELEYALHELTAQFTQNQRNSVTQPQQSSVTQPQQNTETATEKLWLQIDIEGSQVFDNLHEHLQQIVEGFPIEILRIRRIRQHSTTQIDLKQMHLQELSPSEVFRFRLAHDEHIDEPTQQRLMQKFAVLNDELTLESEQ